MTEEDRMIWPEHPTCHAGAHPSPRDHQHWRAPREGDPFRTCGYCGSIHPGDLVAALEAGAKLGGSDWKYGWPHKFYVEGIPDTRQGQMVEKGSKSIDDQELRDWLRAIPEDEQIILVRSARAGVSPDPALFRSAHGSEFAAAVAGGESFAAGGIIGRAMARMAAAAKTSTYEPLALTCDPILYPATTAHAKWYNEHLQDEGYSPDARARLIELLHERAGILFEIDADGKLRYSAPYRGYQHSVSGA